MGFIKLLIGLPLLIIVSVFAFVNNDLATFNLWPFFIEITVSLSVVIVFLIVFGFALGSFFSWLSYAPVRIALRKHKKQNKKLNKTQLKLVKEVEGLQLNIETLKELEMLKPKISFNEKFKLFFKRKNKEEAQININDDKKV